MAEKKHLRVWICEKWTEEQGSYLISASRQKRRSKELHLQFFSSNFNRKCKEDATIPLKQQRWNTVKKKRHDIEAHSFFIFPHFSSSSSLMSFLHIGSALGAARPRGAKLHAQSSLRRRAALIGADRATWGKDATNWEGEGGPGEGSALGRWLSTWLRFARCCVWKPETSRVGSWIFTAVSLSTNSKNRGLRTQTVLSRKIIIIIEKTAKSLRHFTELWLKTETSSATTQFQL